MGRKIATMILDGPDPMVLDMTLNNIDSIPYARDDIDHKAWLPYNQKLVFNTTTGEIMTINYNNNF